MADIKKRLDTNIEGDFFVDSTCINCDTCRQLAPTIFKDTGEYSSTYAQPQNKEEIFESQRIIHHHELHTEPGSEIVFEGNAPIAQRIE